MIKTLLIENSNISGDNTDENSDNKKHKKTKKINTETKGFKKC